MSRGQEKIDRGHNSLLKRVLDNHQDKKMGKNEIISIISCVLSFLAIIISIFMPLFLYKKNLYNESLVLNSEINIQLSDVSKDSYIIEFDIAQGGIKKAYIATVFSDGSLIYESILQYSNGNTIKLTRNARKSNKECNSIIDSTQFDKKGTIEGVLEENSIDDFALVLLDTTDQWWIYYFISTPEYIPINSSYCLEVLGEDGEIVASYEKDLEVQEMSKIIIDGSLINVVSIEEDLEDLETDYYLFNSSQSFVGTNGEFFESNPKIVNIYELPSATDVYNNIIRIHEDIKELSF